MYPHGSNIAHKMQPSGEYADSPHQTLLAEIAPKYQEWRAANEALVGPGAVPGEKDREIVARRVELFDGYKAFIDQECYAKGFDSRSNLHSTVLEEFLEYLFRDLVGTFVGAPAIGKAHTFKDIFFSPPCYQGMVSQPSAVVETKDHDFMIGVRMLAALRCGTEGDMQTQELEWDIPAIAIECKTYLDKTMLEASSTSAEQLKARNPNALYIVVMEYIKLTPDVNLRKFKVDEVFVLRRQKNVDRKYRVNLDPATRVDSTSQWEQKPISAEVVWRLFGMVRSHLIADWSAGALEARIERGYLMGE